MYKNRIRWMYSFLFLAIAVNAGALSGYSQTTPRILQAHSARVQSVTFSQKGHEFASAGWDGKVKIWDAKKLVVKRTLVLKGGKANSVAFSRDGRLIACGFAIPRPKAYETGKVLVWETKTGKLLHTLIPKEADSGGVWGIAISPDSNSIAGVGGRVIDVWDVKSGKRKMAVMGDYNETFDNVSFSPDGKIIVATGDNFSPGILKVWSASTGSRLKPYEDESFEGWTPSLSFSPDSKRLVVGGGRQLDFWDTGSRKLLYKIKGLFGAVISVAYSPDGKTVASASNRGELDGKGELQLWDARTGKLLKTLPDHPKAILSVAFSPDGRTIISGGR